MVATGNVGLAWLLVCLAGLATTLGACIVWCVSLAQPKLLAGSLGFAAGVMLYVSFAEIFLRKSVAAFENISDPNAAYRWSTLCFFGGMLIVLVLDKIVHALAHWNDRRLGMAGGSHGGIGPSVSTANLLSHEDPERRSGWRRRRRRARADDGSAATKPPLPAVMEVRTSGGCAGAGGEAAAAAAAAAAATAAGGDEQKTHLACDVEAGGGQDTDVDSARAQQQGGSASACSEGSSTPPRQLSAPVPGLPDTLCDSVVGDIVAATSPSVVEADLGDVPPTPGGGGTSRTPPAVVQIMEADHHAFMLKKMGVLTAVAIFIHNFPEGLATFVGALADTKIGIGLAVAIAMHNIPEGICVAMPIYYATGSKWKGFWWAFLSGASEPLGALVGYLALSGSNTDLSFAIVFGLVAGMMVYISVKELVPTALRYDPQDSVATTCVIAGMVVMAASLLLFTI